MLSCYTTNLVDCLRPEQPDVDRRFAEAVALSVRVDRPDVVAFTHHAPVDPRLGYRSAGDWAGAAAGLREELADAGRVLAVANTRNLPWAPPSDEDVPHWVLVTDRADGRWLVVDGFEALLPHGEQRPYRGWFDDDALRELLAPLPPLRPEVHNRDVHALGVPVAVPEPGRYRWLSRRDVPPPLPLEGRWVTGTEAALRYLAEHVAGDPAALGRHAEDLWAASRHHQFKHAGDPEAAAAWAELPRAVRFAVQSAERGRPRPALVVRAFEEVIAVERRNG